MIKLIFCDMDGTLLDAEGNLPPDFDDTMAEVIRRGAIFVPASGRQYSALIYQMGKYIDDFIFMAENGSLAMRNDEELFSYIMSRENIMRVLETGLAIPGAFPVLCAKRTVYVTENWRPYLAKMEKYFTKNEIVPNLKAKAASEDCIKVAFCDVERGDAEYTIYPPLRALEGPVHVALSSNYWIDVMCPEVNKGVSARRLQEILGVSPDECAAFGDYLNDIEMLRSVKFGFAMANSHPDVIAATSFTAPANTEHGVTKKLRELMEAGMI